MECEHEWQPCATPPDSGRPWYRCNTCKVFACRRGIKIVPYRCTVQGCKKLAVDRLHGRGPRASYLWRCEDHLEPRNPVES